MYYMTSQMVPIVLALLIESVYYMIYYMTYIHYILYDFSGGGHRDGFAHQIGRLVLLHGS